MITKKYLYNLYVSNGSIISNGSTQTIGSLYINNGNVGINNTDPQAKFDINGTFNVIGNSTFGSNVVVSGPALKIPTGNILSRPNINSGGYIRYNTETQQFEGYGPGNAWGSLGGVVDIAQTTKILASATPSTTDGNLYFYTTGVERMRMNSSGNIGINNSSPNYTLDISGTLNVSNNLISNNLTANKIIANNSASDVIKIQNISNSGNSSINFLDENSTSKISIGYANSNSNLTNMTGAGYILSNNNISINIISGSDINLIAGNNLNNPIVLNGIDNSISIKCNTNANDIYTGALNVSGGVGIQGKLFVGGNLSATNSIITALSSGTLNATGITTSTLLNTGLISTANLFSTTATVPNIVHTNISSATLVAGTVNVTTGITTAALLNTGLISTSNLFSTTATVPNAIFTNVSSATLVAGTVNVTTGITTAALLNTGLISTSNLFSTTATVPNAIFTNISSATLVAGTVNVTTGITTAALLNTGLISTSNLFSTTATVPNIVHTNISSATLVAGTGITTAALLNTGLISTSNLFSTTATVPNIVHTNISSATLNVTTGITTAALLTTGLISTSNLFSTTATVPNAIFTNISSATLVAGTGITSTSAQITNIVSTSISTGTLSSTTITGANLSLSGNLIVGGTLTTVNITSTNILNTNISVGTIISTGLSSLQNVTLTNASASTLNISTGITAANALITTSTIATARVTSNLLALGNSNTLGNLYTTGGNVGINIVNPGYTLDVNVGIAGFAQRLIGSGNDSAVIRFENTNAAGGIYHVGSTATGSGGGRGFSIFDVSNAASRVLIGSSGNIGIGTITPTAQLNVSNDFTISANNSTWNSTAGKGLFMRYSTNGVQDGAFIQSIDRTTSIVYPITIQGSTINLSTDAGAASRLFINATGNVGISTTSPNAQLQLGNTIVNRKIVLYDTNNNDHQYFGLGINNSSFRYQVDNTGCGHDFYAATSSTSSQHLMRIRGDGNVGIGTTSPSGMLHLNNAAVFTNVGNLTCAGDIISFGSVSDFRLKKNIESIEPETASNIVRLLRPVTFNWKSDISNVEKRNKSDAGFIAQEVETVIPVAVSEFSDVESGEIYKNMKYERIIPYLVGAIQKLEKQNDKLEKENLELKERILKIEKNFDN